MSPFTQVYQYSSKADEEIFANSVTMIKGRLDRNLKININEAIAVYSSFIVSELRDGKSVERIQANASYLLSPEQVMIGVPETLRTVSFEVTLDDAPMKIITLSTPIQISDYILKST
ncbi:MAG: urease subunit gamma [Candidatus Nitrosotenuis sp.]|nr:MAG: urease subunit gamma [Candidatus Nitrosotenuis sp.]